MSRIQAILLTFVRPVQALTAVAGTRSIVAPLALSTVLSVGLTAIALPRLNLYRQSAEAVSMQVGQGTMTLSQWNVLIAEEQKTQVKAAYVASLATPMVQAFAVTVLMVLGLGFVGGKPGFVPALAVSAHALLPLTLKRALSIAAVFPRRNVPLEGLGRLLPSNPGAFLPLEAHGAGVSLLTSLDLFSVWSLALLVVGLSPLAQLTRRRTAAVTLAIWGVYVAASVLTSGLSNVR
jgi:hypothetical protein